LPPYGNSQIGRIMFGKKHKLENTVISAALTNMVVSLGEAQRVATKREDLEGLVVVAERWLLMAEKVKSLDDSKPIMLGFTSGSPSEEECEYDMEEEDGKSDEH